MKLGTHLMLALLVVLWGSSYVFIKIALQEISPMTLAFLRFAIAAPFLVALARRSGGNQSMMKSLKVFFILGATGVAAYHAFQNVGINLTSASESSLIVGSNPVFISLLGHWYLNERLTLSKLAGVILAFSGVAVIVIGNGLEGLTTSFRGVMGDLLCLGAVLSWAVYSVYGKRKLLALNSYEVTAYPSVYGALLLMPLAFYEGFSLPSSLGSWLCVLYLSLLCTGLAYLIWYKALEKTTAYRAASYLFFIPVVSILTASVLLGERIDPLFTVGTVLVMAGVFITERGILLLRRGPS